MPESTFERLKRERAEKEAAAKGTTTGVALASSTPSVSAPAVATPPQKVEVSPVVGPEKATMSQPATQTPTAIATPKLTPAPVVSPPLPTKSLTQSTVPTTTKTTTLEAEYDDTPMEEEEGLGIMIYGGKGDGKTSLTYSVTKLNPNAKIAVLSFDLQSNRIKKDMYDANPNIVVYDPQRYRTKETDDDNLQSAEKTFNYIRHLLTPKNINNPADGGIYKMKPDYILFDGLEIWKEICEMAMRSQCKYRPYEHFADWDAWRKRTDLMDDIDTIAKKLAQKAVVYTGYVKMQEVKDKQGNITSLKEPKWAGNTKTRTSIVIFVESETTANGRNYYATIESSKVRSMPTCGKKLVGKINDQEKTVEMYGFKELGTL